MTDRADAELAIRNVVALLAQLADSGDVDGYAGLLADDVVWAMPENPAVGLAASERRGRDEIATGQRDRIAAGLQGPGSNTMHLVTTTSVALSDDGSTAVARSCFQYWADTTTAPVVRNVGRYVDDFRRTDAGWKLARRTITFG
jgi:ketosteroid isomerase-like protein